MKKNCSKIYLILALGITPTVVFADYTGCRNAGGSMWDCFWEAAWADGGSGSPGGLNEQTNNKVQTKKTFDELRKNCSKIPINEQMSCLSEGFKSTIKADKDKKIIDVEEKNKLKKMDKLAPSQISANKDEYKSKKVQKASKKIIKQFRKEINKKTPEKFLILLKNMESNYNFAYDLTHAIGSRNKNKVNKLLSKATKTKMYIDYLDSGADDILAFKICASINGTRRCFPSQRNSMDCPKF